MIGYKNALLLIKSRMPIVTTLTHFLVNQDTVFAKYGL